MLSRSTRLLRNESSDENLTSRPLLLIYSMTSMAVRLIYDIDFPWLCSMRNEDVPITKVECQSSLLIILFGWNESTNQRRRLKERSLNQYNFTVWVYTRGFVPSTPHSHASFASSILQLADVRAPFHKSLEKLYRMCVRILLFRPSPQILMQSSLDSLLAAGLVSSMSRALEVSKQLSSLTSPEDLQSAPKSSKAFAISILVSVSNHAEANCSPSRRVLSMI